MTPRPAALFAAPVLAFALGLSAGLLAPAASYAAPAAGEGAFLATTLNVEASGEVKAAPDQATITLGVQTQGKTAGDAMTQNRERMAATLAALKTQGVEAKDIRTTALNLNAQYAYENGQAPRLTGYQASNEVAITVRDVTKLGATVDAVTGAGANQVTGISFGLADARPVEDVARRAAVKQLQARAALYAEATGMKVARLVNLSEGGGYQPGPVRPLPMMAMRKNSAPTPIEPGELTVRIDVSAVYELAR